MPTSELQPTNNESQLPGSKLETKSVIAEPASSAVASGGSAAETRTGAEHTPSNRAEPVVLLPEIPGYVLVRRIGGGGMGVVYEAINRLGRRFALKVIRPDRADEDFRARFRKEAAALLDLDHPHIARIFEYNETDGVPYFTMRLLTGGPLSARMAEFQGDVNKAVALVAKIADAVGFLHRRGMLHRDLKPANVLFDEDGQPYVSDFGLVKELAAAEPDRPANVTDPVDRPIDSPGDTSTGQVIGTPRYMSPEQMAGQVESVTARSDVWALGVILHELLTSRRPFDDQDQTTKSINAENQKLRPIQELKTGVDVTLDKIVRTCLAREPEHRYATANELAVELHRWLAAPAKRRARRRLLGGLAFVAGALILSAAIAVPLYRHYTDPERPLRAAQQQLERGEPVEVVPQEGLAPFAKVRTGDEASLWLEKDRTMTVTTQRLALVEVMPDPMCERYRFKVQVRQNVAAGKASRAGIYCLHSAHEKDGNVHHGYVELSVRDDDEDERELWDFKGPGADLAVTSIAFAVRASGEAPIYHKNNLIGQDAFETEALKGKPGPWHELEFEVTPEQVSAKHKGKRVGLVKNDALKRRMNSLLLGPKNLAILAPVALRSGLGLYVLGSSASFRLGAVEPLLMNSK